MERSKIEQRISDQHHQAVKNKSSKTERHYRRILDKNSGISTGKKKQREEIDKQSGSYTNENTSAIVIDDESKYYYDFLLSLTDALLITWKMIIYD